MPFLLCVDCVFYQIPLPYLKSCDSFCIIIIIIIIAIIFIVIIIITVIIHALAFM